MDNILVIQKIKKYYGNKNNIKDLLLVIVYYGTTKLSIITITIEFRNEPNRIERNFIFQYKTEEKTLFFNSRKIGRINRTFRSDYK